MNANHAPAPETSARFREDLDANLRLVESLAPTHCTDCSGYHLDRARRRLKPGSPEALDRSDMVRLIRGCLADRRPLVDILIAGAGDANLLATSAEAAGDAARYIVLDHCRTPLVLCRAFARQHGLSVETRQVDMGAPDVAFAADLVVVHSLLRFLPPARHVAALQSIRQWLKPGGSVIFSHRLIARPPDDVFYRSEFGSVAPIVDLLSQCGFRIAALEEQVENAAAAQGRAPRRRLLALLQPA